MVISYARYLAGLTIALGVFGSVAAQAATPPAQLCRAKQIAAAGKACGTVLKKCYGSVAKSGMPVDEICLGDVLVTLTSDLEKADDGGGCDQVRLATPINDRLSDLADDIANGELSSRAGGICAVKKLAAAAKKCMSFAKCYASAAKKSDMFTPDSACLSSASGKFSDAFTKIEASVTCTPAGNAGAIEALIDQAVSDLSDLATVGTTTTTTTTLP
jgi:hypothetical protein